VLNITDESGTVVLTKEVSDFIDKTKEELDKSEYSISHGLQQSLNLVYVILTRAKHSIVYENYS